MAVRCALGLAPNGLDDEEESDSDYVEDDDEEEEEDDDDDDDEYEESAEDNEIIVPCSPKKGGKRIEVEAYLAPTPTSVRT